MKPAPAHPVDLLVRLRARLVLGMVAVLLVVLLGRLFHIQVMQHEAYLDRALKQQRARVPLKATRGTILTSDGEILARPVTVKSLVAVPRSMFGEEADPVQVLRRAAVVLGRGEPWVQAKAAEIRAKADKYFVWLARSLRPEVYRKLADLDLPGIRFEDEERQVYPRGRLASQVIGFCDADNKGLEGLELSLDPWLRGRDGWRDTWVDARRRRLALSMGDQEAAVGGMTAVLTLDAFVQQVTERVLDRVVEEHRPQGVTAVVLDPRDGRILAMASRPGFDPNERGSGDPAAHRNRAVTDVFEPGSTLKAFVAGLALEAGVVQPDTVFDCHQGLVQVGSLFPRLAPDLTPIRRRLRDDHPYGELSFTDVVVKSSNIGMAQVGLKLGIPGTCQGLAAFGFGMRTGVDLPGEVSGVLRPLREWTGYTITSVPMGHEISVTALQLAAGWGALAHPEGLLHTPRLVDRLVRPDGVTAWASRPQPVSKPLSAATQATLRDILVQVVDRGTGKRARIPGVAVAGKTGTTRKIDPEHGGYSSTRHVATFCAFAPAEDPTCVVVVSVDEPEGNSYGGVVSAPAVKAILTEILPHLGEAR